MWDAICSETRYTRRDELCQEEISRSTPTNRSAKLNTSPKDTKTAAFRRRKPRAARGRPSTRNPAVARRAAADVARRKTAAPRAKVERRAARSDNGHGKTRSRKT